MSRSDNPYRPRNFFIVLLACAVFLGFGVYVLLAVVIPDSVRYLKFQRAVPAQVTQVVSARLEFFPGRRSGGHTELVCAYRYEYAGQEYTGNRVSVHCREADNFRSREIYRRLKRFKDEGGSLECYLLPSDPTRAVLDRSFQSSGIIALIVGIVALGFGGALIAYALRNRRRFLGEPSG